MDTNSPKCKKRARDLKKKPTAKGCKPGAKGNNFNLWFPTLAKTLPKLAAMTNYEDILSSLKYANEDFHNWQTRQFLTVRMKSVLAAVDAELTAVLSPYWT